MNYREQIIEAILKTAATHPNYSEQVLRSALKRISSDTNLIAFAIELGIDTDALLTVPAAVRS